ncbi:MAG: hypothetical protein Q9165_006666 [Trypethelium subeluteriae]
MPRSPATPQSRRLSNKRSSESTPKDKTNGSRAASEKVSSSVEEIDIGPQVGNFDTATVRQKIRKWQVQGGGVVPADDKVEPDDRASDVEVAPKDKSNTNASDSTPKTPTSAPKGRRSPKLESAGTPTGRKVVHNVLSEDIKVASAPKKRVVSDGHWVRHKGSSRIETIPPLSGSKQDTQRTKQWIERIEAEDSKDGTPASTPGASAKRRASKSTPEAERARVHRAPVTSGHDRRHIRSAGHRRRRNSHGRRSRSGSQSSVDSKSTSSSVKGKGSARKSSRQASQPPPQDDGPESVETPKPRKSSYKLPEKSGGSQEKSTTLKKKQPTQKAEHVSATQQQELGPPVFSNRIEAWLTSTSDPFLDEKEPSSRHTSAGASDKSSKLRRSPKGLTESHEHRIYDSSKQSRRGNDDDRFEVHERPEAPKSASDGSPQSGLKRSKARRSAQSPTKELRSNRVRGETSIREEDAVTVAPSSVDPSNEDGWEDLPKTQPPPLSRRRFPTTGKRLSTIASVETFHTRHHHVAPPSVSETSENTAKPPVDECVVPSEDGDTFDPKSQTGVKDRGTSLKRKLTTHADLMSVLSLPNAGNKSIISARSIRTNRSRLANATIGDLMKELETDEMKYMRELKTLVDGVIPVLLTCVLSKSDSALAAGLFGKASSGNDSNITKPIVDMGIALERLKSAHRRIPQNNPDTLLSWAQATQRIYADYLKAWRLGFQDVVVNLAPAVEEESRAPQPTAHSAGWEEGLPRNEEGYVINGDGERVDVAFLLKRPLVRLKYLAKTLKGINTIKPSQQAEDLAAKYQDLVVEARKRSNEERARLEDEAAASIDATRARDPKTLAPLAGVSIDPKRCVTARDYFDMNLRHSSGQLLDCKVEILVREDAPGYGSSGDILICEVSSAGRWLLFPPFESSRVSARNGDVEREIVVMITGMHSGGQEWQELMSLFAQDEQTGFEWVQMLGLNPIPPALPRRKSFHAKEESSSPSSGSHLQIVKAPSVTPLKSRTPSPREIEVPIGEQAKSSSKSWNSETPARGGRGTPTADTPSPKPYQDRTRPKSSHAYEEPYFYERGFQEGHIDSSRSSVSESLTQPTIGSNASPNLRRSKAQRHSRHATLSPTSDSGHKHSHLTSLDNPSSPIKESRPSLYSHPTSSTTSSGKDYKVWFPPTESDSDDSPDESTYDVSRKKSHSRPGHRDRASSVPSLDLPSIPRVRQSSQPTTPQKTGTKHDYFDQKISAPTPEKAPASAPSKLQKRRSGDHTSKRLGDRDHKETPPPPPAHQPQKSSGLKNALASSFTPLIPGFRQHRRSSSPLKHEYEPSTASESSEESDQSGFDDNASVTSESSGDGNSGPNIATPIPPPHGLAKLTKRSPEGSVYSFPNANATLSPSQSASQAPYRTVPPQTAQASKTIASIFSWSDAGQWEPLHPDECSIVITPGLIEAFELTAAHSQTLNRQDEDPEASNTEPPLVALELTPLVPIRRGTALDISIRSPPTANSKVRSGNNIMFRSRSSEECEALYNLINHSRINNPTYIALQNARGPLGESSWAAAMDRRNSQRGGGGGGGSGSGSSSTSWWRERLGSRASSYRAKSSRSPSSIAAHSESSVATMTSAFSALKRFTTGGGSGGGSRLFNVARSTISSRDGTLSNSTASASWSSSSGSSTPVPPTLSAGTAGVAGGVGGGVAGVPPAQMGITSIKVRLYQRETASKWRDMGSARLTIMQPSRAPSASASAAGPASPGVRGGLGAEKRIMVNGKTKGEVLLDVTLGESNFERVARTGIAVSVWEEHRGPNGEMQHVMAKGGVTSARVKVYMIQVSFFPVQWA